MWFWQFWMETSSVTEGWQWLQELGLGPWEPEQLRGPGWGQGLPLSTWALQMGCRASSEHGGQGRHAWLHGNSGLTHKCPHEPSGNRTNIYDLASKTQKHHVCPTLLIDHRLNSPPSFKGWDIDLTSQWEESQRICGYILNRPPRLLLL